MKDRFVKGFISGIIAWVPTFIFNYGAFYLKLSTLRWSDFAGIMLYGKKPHGLPENLFALLGVIFFLGLLGVVYAYLIPKLLSEYYVFKSWVYGVTLWFVFYSVTLLFKVNYLKLIPLKTAICNFIGASIWGITLGLAFFFLNNILKEKNS